MFVKLGSVENQKELILLDSTEKWVQVQAEM